MVRADIGEPQGIETLLAETEQAFGGLDILINNVGQRRRASAGAGVIKGQ